MGPSKKPAKAGSDEGSINQAPGGAEGLIFASVAANKEDEGTGAINSGPEGFDSNALTGMANLHMTKLQPSKSPPQVPPERKPAATPPRESPRTNVNQATVVLNGNPRPDGSPRQASIRNEETVVVGRPSASGENVAFGVAKPSTRAPASEHAAHVEAQISVSDTLRLAQARILELENELEKLRSENESLDSLSQKSKERLAELSSTIEKLEKERNQAGDQHNVELDLVRDNLREKEKLAMRLQQKIDELEGRLVKDLRKIRVRERELEHRLEIGKAEREALLRAKDDALLDIQGRLSDNEADLQLYKTRVVELNRQIETQNEQTTRTVRALRLALAALESSDNGRSSSVSPLKKAE